MEYHQATEFRSATKETSSLATPASAQNFFFLRFPQFFQAFLTRSQSLFRWFLLRLGAVIRPTGPMAGLTHSAARSDPGCTRLYAKELLTQLYFSFLPCLHIIFAKGVFVLGLSFRVHLAHSFALLISSPYHFIDALKLL